MREGTLSFTDAAEEVLNRSGDHRPMHYETELRRCSVDLFELDDDGME